MNNPKTYFIIEKVLQKNIPDFEIVFINFDGKNVILSGTSEDNFKKSLGENFEYTIPLKLEELIKCLYIIENSLFEVDSNTNTIFNKQSKKRVNGAQILLPEAISLISYDDGSIVSLDFEENLVQLLRANFTVYSLNKLL